MRARSEARSAGTECARTLLLHGFSALLVLGAVLVLGALGLELDHVAERLCFLVAGVGGFAHAAREDLGHVLLLLRNVAALHFHVGVLFALGLGAASERGREDEHQTDLRHGCACTTGRAVRNPPPMKTALLFPGQGSQRVGMGRDLALAHEVAKRTYQEADDVLGFPLSQLCWEGPEDELTLTKHTQPAILVTSIAVFRCLLEKGLRFDVVAGHSLGEWSALVAAGALELRDAVRLTHLRGTYMQEAVPVGQGA